MESPRSPDDSDDEPAPPRPVSAGMRPAPKPPRASEQPSSEPVAAAAAVQRSPRDTPAVPASSSAGASGAVASGSAGSGDVLKRSGHLALPLVSGFEEGGTMNGWKFDDGMLKSFDIKTDGTWPFVDDEHGLFINCQYSWSGTKLRPREGSGSKGDWNGKLFRWSCFPLGAFHPLYEYSYDEKTQCFRPSAANVQDELPVWELTNNGTLLKNASGAQPQLFKDVLIDGSVPPVLALAVGMHKWQWLREGELTSLGMSRQEDDE